MSRTARMRVCLPVFAAFAVVISISAADPAYAETPAAAPAQAEKADNPVLAAAADSAGATDEASCPHCGKNLPKTVSGCKEELKEPAPLAPGDDDSLKAQVKTALDGGNMLWALILVLLAGLLTALTPCVYPLIPITLSIFGARQTSAARGFLLSATYVSGMVVLYASLGTAFAAFGMLAGSALQSPVVTIGVALFCIALAASMFGAFEFALPGNLQTKLSKLGGTGFRGAFVMGLVAGIIAAPCTGPVLSFILTLIAKDQDVAKGALLMGFYSLGIGLPFLVLGTFSSAIASMPKSGQWMETVKSVFGVLMLAAGLYYLQFGIDAVGDVFQVVGQWPGWLGAVLFALGAAAGAFHLSFKYVPPLVVARKGIGVVLSTCGLLLGIAWLGAVPEAPTGGDDVVHEEHVEWTTIGNEPDAEQRFDALLAKAMKDCKPVMIDFYADWCAACKELDKYVYVTKDVRAEAERFVSIKIDATDETEPLKAIQKRFSILGLPTVVFINSRGDVKQSPRVTGFVEAPAYLSNMKRVR